MDARLVALKLFLDELGIPPAIDTVDDRKRVQKAVYLGQLSTVDLGYRFAWYLMGPYSTELTKDYYGLAQAVASGDREHEGKVFHPSVQAAVASIKPLLSIPAGVELAQENWLELLASYDYLRRVRRLSKADAIAMLAAEKPHVVKYVEEADAQLREAKLVLQH